MRKAVASSAAGGKSRLTFAPIAVHYQGRETALVPGTVARLRCARLNRRADRPPRPGSSQPLFLEEGYYR